MKSIAKLLFILIAGLLAACSNDEPVKDNNGTLLGDPVEPFEFDYSGIDLRAELIYQSPDLIDYYDYYGEIPAEGDSFTISHEYNFYLASKNNMYSMLMLSINGEYLKGNQDKYGYVPSNGIEYSGEWGSVVTRFEDRKTITTFKLEKNETGTPRDINIHLSYITFTADIYLTQESL